MYDYLPQFATRERRRQQASDSPPVMVSRVENKICHGASQEEWL